ncbi:tetratricopeptide repeat protein [Oculatella sp. LEGE 06141]|uniref:tetratricopeptide repeat protein n=1 Tax=Oculatella sp. LEGE 06141 TaxID=1828648 RepID=UPI001881B3FF|nr:tetratricopeptide repeat protein [Oculatella sp. LEGE 06141]MBE9178256.1 tetratricopeptide repeat protein [Oculatella sp. LEGE 06141]
MNTQSSSSRRSCNRGFCSNELTAHKVGPTAYRTQKRWHSKPPSKSSSTTRQKQSVGTLSKTELDNRLRQSALAKAKQGHHEDAIVLFSQLIQRNPDSANDYSNRGLVYFQSGQFDAALADYNTALDLNPRLDSAYNNRANYYASQGQLLEAILDYDTALDLNPGNIRAWINQGITFRDLQMYDQAIISFDLALHFGRFEGHTYAERGRTYHLWGDWNCAIADYKRALEQLPEVSLSVADPSLRLRLQVEGWMDELLEPLQQ